MASSFREGFASVREMVNGLVGSAAKTANNLSTQAKANLAIHTEQERIKQAQLELGTLIYNSISSGEAYDKSAIEMLCNQIDNSYEVIGQQERILAELRAQSAGNVEIEPNAISDSDFADAAPEGEETAE